MSGVEERPSDMVYQDDRSPSRVAEAPNIIAEDDGSVSERNFLAL